MDVALKLKGMEQAEHMKSGPAEVWFCQLQLMVAVLPLVAFNGTVCAQEVHVTPSGGDTFPIASIMEVPSSSQNSGASIALRVSTFLNPARRREGAQPAAKIVPNDARTTKYRLANNLRLDRALASSLQLQASGASLVLPQGGLSQAGIVRATAVQVRDGVFFLVGDYLGPEGYGPAASDAVDRN